MRRCLVLLLIIRTAWAQTDLDKLVLKDGTEYLGEYLLTKGETVHFKQRDESTYKKISVSLIKSIEHRNGIITGFNIIDKYPRIRNILDYENLSIEDKAKKDARKWILYPPTAFLMFGALMLGPQEEPWESFPAILGISAASLTIPYLFLREVTWKNLENLSSRDKRLYEKVYFEEYKRRKYKYIIISTGVTALTVGGVIYYLLDNMSLDFGPSSNAGFH